jgi:hypothetical protein
VRFLIGQSVRNPANSAEFSAHGRPALAHLFLPADVHLFGGGGARRKYSRP